LEKYKNAMSDVLPQPTEAVPSTKRAKFHSPIEQVESDLDGLNRQYMDLVTVVSDRVKMITALLEKTGKIVLVS
jgi:hypothetical protein